MLWDIDSLREKWAAYDQDAEQAVNYGPGANAETDLSARYEPAGAGSHSHSTGRH